VSPSSRTDQKLVIGGSPRADLLPPEIKADVKAASQRRGLFAIVVGAVVVVIAGYALASVYAAGTQSSLDSANVRTADLLTEQGKYVIARQLSDQVEISKQARIESVSTEIDWQKYLNELEKVTSDELGITGITVDSATPLTPFAEPTGPLEQMRVAQIGIVAMATNVPDVAKAVEAISKLPGFVDATVLEVKGKPGAYAVAITVHVNEELYLHRFAEEEETADDAGTEETN